MLYLNGHDSSTPSKYMSVHVKVYVCSSFARACICACLTCSLCACVCMCVYVCACILGGRGEWGVFTFRGIDDRVLYCCSKISHTHQREVVVGMHQCRNYR